MSAVDLIDLARAVAGGLLLWAGIAFVAIGALGVLRFPDFYTRLHAAGVTDTLGAGLTLLGLVVQADSLQTALKLALIGVFLFLTSPAATHALANAAHTAGLEPWLRGSGPEKRES